MLLQCALWTAVGFLSGAIMYSYLLPRLLRRVDVRQAAGDANPGGANAIRSVGLAIGLSCIILDVLKAAVPVYLATRLADLNGLWWAPVLAAPVLGHAFSPMLRFKGGKAVAATFGALLGILPVSRVVLVLAAAMILLKFLLSLKPDHACMSTGLVLAFAASLILEPVSGVKVGLAVISATVIYKLLAKPDEGALSMRLGPWALMLEDRHIRLHKEV